MTLSQEQIETAAKLSLKLSELSLSARFTPPVSVGPLVSVYRFAPLNSTRVASLESLADDFAVGLGVEDVFVKRMPGESAVGIFVPNKTRKPVSFLESVSNTWKRPELSVPLNLGVDHLGAPFVEDLSLLPHLLIAGSTGAGKSTLLSAIIASIIYCRPTVKLLLSDTKNVEFGQFRGAPHLLFEPATSLYQTLEQLDHAIEETVDRLTLMSKCGCRNIHEYNVNPKSHRVGAGQLPFIVIIIDELADLLLDRRKPDEQKGPSLGKIAESKIATITQRARAAGVYLIAATQRPSVNIVVGSIKANFPARLTFRLPSEADSRTVIGTSGAEHLLSRGDMLYISPNTPGLHRLHAPWATKEEITAAVEAASRRKAP